VDDGDTVEVCLSDPEGIDGPAALTICDVVTGFFPGAAAEVVRALGADLRPITPAPDVYVE
jgi:hypothetical protein